MIIKKQHFRIKNIRKITLLILFFVIFIFCNLNASIVVSQEAKSADKVSQEIKSADKTNQSGTISQANQKPNSSQTETKKNDGDSSAKLVFGESEKVVVTFAIIFTFIFYLIGITVNYGYRTYWNSPLHPSFMPFVYVAVAAILAFTVVLTINITIDTNEKIKFVFLGQLFEGASGPVVLWILTFLTIMLGFRLSGATDLAKSDIKANPASHHLLKSLDAKFVICLNNQGYEDSLEVGKLYHLIDDKETQKNRSIRVIDESGKDSAFPVQLFYVIELPQNVEEALLVKS
jgi:hypothetical protein